MESCVNMDDELSWLAPAADPDRRTQAPDASAKRPSSSRSWLDASASQQPKHISWTGGQSAARRSSRPVHPPVGLPNFSVVTGRPGVGRSCVNL